MTYGKSFGNYWGWATWQGFTNIVSTNVASGQDVDLRFTISAPGATVEEVQDALSDGAIATGKN